jgi:hypothetical protein
VTESDRDVEVTQADRDAAADLMQAHGKWARVYMDSVREGRQDDADSVQAFARHRLAALSAKEPTS